MKQQPCFDVPLDVECICAHLIMSTNERSGIATHTGGTPLGRGAHIVIRHQSVPGSLKLILALVRATSRCFTQHPQWSWSGTAGTDVALPACAIQDD